MIWFDELKIPYSPSASEQEAAIEFAVETVLRHNTSANLPTLLEENQDPQIIFVSVSDGKMAARVAWGSGRGMAMALRAAIATLQPLVQQGYHPRWLKLDLVHAVFSLERLNSKRVLPKDRSLYGLGFDKQSGIAFLPEELLAYTLVDKQRHIQPKNIARYLKNSPTAAKEYHRLLHSRTLKLYLFTTTSIFSDGEQAIPLYRGHRYYRHIHRDELLDSARAGGQYLRRSVKPGGKFDYIYHPKTNTVLPKYNILRHAGTIYSMLELYEVTGETELVKAAKEAIAYLLESIHPDPQAPQTTLCVVEQGYVKLGGNALGAIALAKYTEVTGDQQYLPILLKLGRWIQHIQSENGKFTVHKQSYREAIATKFVSEYYPGEALLALTRLYKLVPEESWLDTAEAGALYLINVRDGTLHDSQLAHDHWLLYALNELYRHRKNPHYLTHALRIANVIVQSQNRRSTPPDWRGSFYKPPRSTPTATRMEGLCAAYQLARDYGYPQQAKAILKAIWLGVAFGLQTQFRPESVLYLPDPQRCLGGFHCSLTNFEIRIDYVQHNISSLLGLYQISGD